MRSNTRISCDNAVKKFTKIINQNILENNILLYVGIAGDPPGGEYSYLFPKFNILTIDVDEKWHPDIVMDITKTALENNSIDCVVCVQTIEHIPNIWDLPNELFRILRPGGYAIIDCPWNHPYHPEPPSFGDYWRVSKDGMKQLFKNKFKIIEIIMDEYNTSVFLRKN